jgi:N-acyl-D-aspartate/D-glutamate deacylase
MTLLGSAAAAKTPVDLLIQNGQIFTGEDRAPFTGDVAVSGDKIVYVGPPSLGRFAPTRTIAAKGLVVAPGFIDVHTHPETYIDAHDEAARKTAPWITQGVTTIFRGVDGGGDPDVASVFSALTSRPAGVNVAAYVGFGAVRVKVLGLSARAPSSEELDRMRALVVQGMCAGALGLSTGLFYTPQSYARTDEVVALAREAAVRGGLYDTHQRDESSYGIGLMASTREAIEIGQRAGLPVHFAHLKALGVDVQGSASALVNLIDKARAGGLAVTADQYPWLASGTGLEPALVPPWAAEGGQAALKARLLDPGLKARLAKEMGENLRRRGGAGAILFTDSDSPYLGRRLSELAAEWGVDGVAAAQRVLLTSPDTASIASFNMIDADVDLIMRQPWVMTGSDGSDGHPRQYATFPKKYEDYVRRRSVITLKDFIIRSSALPADVFGLKGRGRLLPGAFADVVVFDPESYAPRADYLHPRVLSTGVRTLLVNGALTIDEGQMTGRLAGRPLPRAPLAGTCAPS